MKMAEQLIESLVDGEVVSCKGGYGSFIDLEIQRAIPYQDKVKLWVYLADWALMYDDTEILASDMPDNEFICHKERLRELEGKIVTQVSRLEAEVHLMLSAKYRLEIWSNPEAYGFEAPMVKVFLDSKHVGNLYRISS